MNHVSFNLRQDLFVAGSKGGFAVYQTDPFKETVRRSIASGVLLVQLMGRTNILAVVTTARPSCVQFWDDTSRDFKFELDMGTENVKSIKLSRDVIVIALMRKIHIYKFSSQPVLLHNFDTIENNLGLVTMSDGPQCIVAFPARRPGFLQIVHVDVTATPVTTSRSPAKIVIVSTHSSELGCITMNVEGSRIATASVHGTLIRVWDTLHGRQVAELRRGMDKAVIHSMTFSPTSPTGTQKLAVISDKATAHIYHLCDDTEHLTENRKSSLAALASFGASYFGSSWSIAQARIEEPPLFKPKVVPKDRKYLIGWVNEDLFIVLSSDGGLWKYLVTRGKKHSEQPYCQQEAYRRWQQT